MMITGMMCLTWDQHRRQHDSKQEVSPRKTQTGEGTAC